MMRLVYVKDVAQKSIRRFMSFQQENTEGLYATSVREVIKEGIYDKDFTYSRLASWGQERSC